MGAAWPLRGIGDVFVEFLLKRKKNKKKGVATMLVSATQPVLFSRPTDTQRELSCLLEISTSMRPLGQTIAHEAAQEREREGPAGGKSATL